MKFKEIQKELKNNLKEYFKPKNFKLKTTETIDGFYIYRKTDYGTELIKIGVTNYSIEFGLYASFMVCYSDVTKILKEARGKEEDFNLNFTYTLAHEKQNDILSGFIVNEKKDVQYWINEILIPYFNLKVLSFFDKYDNIKELDTYFNSKKNKHFSKLSSIRAQKSIIVAKLNNNSDYKELTDFYYNELKKKNILYEYPDVLSYLSLKN